MKKSLKKLLTVSLAASVLFGADIRMVIAENTSEATSEQVENSESETDTQMDGLPLVSKADLSEANGQDGNPAYVAVFGYVYDVTDIAEWENGKHNGAQAGTDASSFFIESPHAIDTLEGLDQVGVYNDWEVSDDLLAEFNNENEELPNLVAVRGIVYDVTDEEAWPNGEHNGISAGTDATDNFENDSPHEDDLLSTLKIVGKHVDYVFSEDELTNFDGKDGNPAYIAVDGTVYDVTNFGAWADGEHQDMVTAGTDATDLFESESPHNTEFLEALPLAGRFE